MMAGPMRGEAAAPEGERSGVLRGRVEQVPQR